MAMTDLRTTVSAIETSSEYMQFCSAAMPAITNNIYIKTANNLFSVV